MAQGKRVSDSVEFPLIEFDKKIVDLVAVMPTPERFPAFNSIRHLNRAWKIRTIDLEMAAFRSITAEEESATALILALQRLKYDGANELDPRNHLHKNAITPFFDAFANTASRFGPEPSEYQLFIDAAGKCEKLAIRFELPRELTPEPMWAMPTPPLNVIISRGGVGQAKREEDFAEGVSQLARDANSDSILAFLRDRANQRNRLLYAAKGGFNQVGGDPDEICVHYQRNTFLILKVCLLISPYRRKQPLVQQCLIALLKILKRQPKNIQFG